MPAPSTTLHPATTLTASLHAVEIAETVQDKVVRATGRRGPGFYPGCLEQPHVLDRDHRLIDKSFGQIELHQSVGGLFVLGVRLIASASRSGASNSASALRSTVKL